MRESSPKRWSERVSLKNFLNRRRKVHFHRSKVLDQRRNDRRGRGVAGQGMKVTMMRVVLVKYREIR